MALFWSRMEIIFDTSTESVGWELGVNLLWLFILFIIILYNH